MQILKTTVDHGAVPVVGFHGEGGEEIHVRLGRRSSSEDDEMLVELAKVMMLHAAAFDAPATERRSRPATRVEQAIEADHYARRTGISKKEAFGMLRDGTASPAEVPAVADPLVLFLAEHTDLSPNQARDLVDREGRNLHKLRKIARTMKAES